MEIIKYISTKDAVRLTGLSTQDIYDLIHSGKLPARKAPKSGWRISPKDLVALGLIQEESESMVEKQKSTEEALPSGDTRLIIENHYQEVIERICAAKSSIKIMTGDFKRFKLKPTAKQGKNYNDGTPFIRFLMEKAEEGVSVEIICSSPSRPFKEEYGELYEQMNPKLFRIFFCIRNHAKVVIVDDKVAYVGSANVTKAGLGQGVLSPGNFEAGIMTDNPAFISSLDAHFSKIMDGDYCDGCHRANQCIEY